LVAAPKLPAPLPSKTDKFEFWLAVARSCLPSPLKSPTATERGLVPAPKFVAVEKLTELHVAGVVTVKVNILLVVPPAPNALTVTMYVPAGCASVTRTVPVVGFAASVPLKLVEVETLMLVVPVGAASGVTVVFAPNATMVSP
jgi:hypothetical protein